MYYSKVRFSVKFFTISPQVSSPSITQTSLVTLNNLSKVLPGGNMLLGRARKSSCVTGNDEVDIIELGAGTNKTVFEIRFIR